MRGLSQPVPLRVRSRGRQKSSYGADTRIRVDRAAGGSGRPSRERNAKAVRGLGPQQRDPTPCRGHPGLAESPSRPSRESRLRDSASAHHVGRANAPWLPGLRERERDALQRRGVAVQRRLRWIASTRNPAFERARKSPAPGPVSDAGREACWAAGWSRQRGSDETTGTVARANRDAT